MLLPGWGARTVRMEQKASDVAEASRNIHERFDDALMALEWLLARDPNVGTPNTVNGVDWWLHVQKADQIAETPAIWVLYKVTENEVQIFDMNVVGYNEDSI